MSYLSPFDADARNPFVAHPDVLLVVPPGSDPDDVRRQWRGLGSRPIVCTGPGTGHSCPLVTGGTCPLVEEAPVVLIALPPGSARDALLDALEWSYPDVPLIDVAEEQEEDHTGDGVRPPPAAR